MDRGSFSPEELTEFVNLMQVYEGAMYEISTKLEILDSEFQVRFSHDPIHHMERRLKSVNSILGKLKRKTLPVTVSSIKDNLFDVAGIRVICNYRDDVYSVSNYLSAQNDISVLRVKDYIKNPKQNGYRSLHVIYAVPVFPLIRRPLHPGGGPVPHHRDGLLGESGARPALQDRSAGCKARRALADAA
ncbi:GTP pyrophosphokinase [Bifidobacterium bifidum]|nr:RelA/SpoT domain protein [Bifidobacterium bifidum ATCC 29521 = JCM 1255 = DSM 20456]VEG17944.1 GTP pyrophosphokinase [Bifidobacterium bifidum]